MKATPLMKLIEFIETMPASNIPATLIKAKATELLAEEARYVTDEEIDAMWPNDGSDANDSWNAGAKAMRDMIFGFRYKHKQGCST